MIKLQRKQVEREELRQQGIKEYMASFRYPMAYDEQIIMLAEKSPTVLYRWYCGTLAL